MNLIAFLNFSKMGKLTNFLITGAGVYYGQKSLMTPQNTSLHPIFPYCAQNEALKFVK